MKVLYSKKVFVFFIFISVVAIILYQTVRDVTIPAQTVNVSKTVNNNDFIKESEKNVVSEKKTLIEQKTTSEKIAISKKKMDLKYILQWTSPRNVPFVYMGEGQQGFIERNCPHVNCFVTADKNYLGDYTKFDVIAFAGPEIVHMPQSRIPDKRSPHQKFAFASIESSDYYPICSNRLDGYFNWTWTFRLDSEVRWGYIAIRDNNNTIVGPNKEMNWMKLEDMEPVSDIFKEKLKSKTKAAAWFVSNCFSKSKRENFVRDLQQELKKYDLVVDVYGTCGSLQCSRDKEKECQEMIREQYYFYLSFENSFSEDYVTEKLLHALQFDAVPIVFGAANYTRFMPDGIYLNARELGVTDLAAKMDELIKSQETYADMFKWKNHYSYHRNNENVDTDEYCLFCAILNDDKIVNSTKVYQNFREWWDPPNRC